MENSKVILEEKTGEVKELRQAVRNITLEKVDIFNDRMEMLSETLEFNTRNKLYFTHPKYKHISSRGPIIGYDTKENNLCIYDLKDKCIKEISMYNTEKEKALFEEKFFGKYSFEDAMLGLESADNLIDCVIKELTEYIEEEKRSLYKYKV